MGNAHRKFADQIVALAEERQLSLMEVARLAGLRDNTLYRLHSSEPKIGRVVAICDALDLEFYIGPPRGDGEEPPALPVAADSPPALMRDFESHTRGLVKAVLDAGGDPIPEDLWPVLADRRGLTDASALASAANDDTAPPEARPVAVYQVAAAAGGGALIEDAPPAGPAWFRRDWLDKYGIDPTRCVVIGVKGESMEPTLPDGCSILLDKTRVDLQAERIYAVTTSDGLVVKRAGKDDEGDWVLRSDHPAWVDAPWPDDAEMVGEVRWAGWSLS